MTTTPKVSTPKSAMMTRLYSAFQGEECFFGGGNDCEKVFNSSWHSLWMLKQFDGAHVSAVPVQHRASRMQCKNAKAGMQVGK